ncbi:MAG TPA: PQQ-binding-like beta-propeller repeat protein, partial [Pyrinomonadaceae bacterium]
SSVSSQPAWQADLDSKIRFYQTTDFGILLTVTERRLYALDGQTGERLWRRDTGRINETAITPVPGTDLVLLSRDLGSKSRLEAVDVITGESLWESDKVKGDVMQLAVEPRADLLVVVLVRDARGNAGSELKRKPVVHVLRLSDGDELWKKQLDGDIEMMPSRFGEGLGEIAFTLDNYRAPLLVDGRLFLFYDGATSYDARTGKEKEREKFRINEEGLALTEADPVIDDSRIYLSGRGRIRAVNRRSGNVEWKADDIGNAAEMALVGNTLYVRTGGQFTRLRDGEHVAKGPFGIAAIDTRDGDVKWRYKGADKGLTNFVFVDPRNVILADRDDVITLDAETGRKRDSFEHRVERPQFILLNEAGNIVIGGREELAAFEFRSNSRAALIADRGVRMYGFVSNATADKARELWRVRHKAPGRGAFRIMAGIALRATALYFRYGGLATSAFGLARGGLTLAGAANSFRWSGVRSRFGSFDLTTLASRAARNYVSDQIYTFGSLARTAGVANRASGVRIVRGGIANRVTPSGAEVSESVFDRLDPARYADRLSDYLLRRKRLSELRGNHMYFYTDLDRPFDRKGLVGVNIHTGKDARFILGSDPDQHFVTDETLNLLYSADGDKLQAFDIMSR